MSKIDSDTTWAKSCPGPSHYRLSPFWERDRFASSPKENQSPFSIGEALDAKAAEQQTEARHIDYRTLILPITLVLAQARQETPAPKPEPAKTEPAKPEEFKPEQQASKGSVIIGGNTINYDAFAGTLIVHSKGWDDVPQNADKDDKNKAAEASMFYVAYFKSDNHGAARPLTFLYNGGPGSSTVWLHMGAFGPKRVLTANDTHTPAAPYPVVTTSTPCWT